MSLGGRKPTLLNQTPNTREPYHGSQTTGDKLRRREGNNPDRPLRSPSHAQCERKLDSDDRKDVGLEAAIISKVRNSLLVEQFRAENDRD